MKKFTLLVVLLIVMAVTVSSPTIAAVDGERDALMALYDSTDGPNWRLNTGWGTDDPYCNWWGVVCSAGLVTSLDLHDNHLEGAIPARLGNLSNLVILYLHDNRLNGAIPAELGNLSNLWDLYLHDNQLSGGIPAELLAGSRWPLAGIRWMLAVSRQPKAGGR